MRTTNLAIANKQELSNRVTLPFPLSELNVTPFKSKQVRMTAQTVNIQKNGTIYISSGIVRKERLFFHENLKVGYDKQHNCIVLTFTQRMGFADDKFHAVKRGDAFTISLKSFFTFFGIDLSKNLGKHEMIKYKDLPNRDKTFIIPLGRSK